MKYIKRIMRLLGWLATILLQIIASFLVIFIISVIFAGVDTISRVGWLALLFVIWFGYMVGINLVGQAALLWAWKDIRTLPRQRLIASALAALTPLLILLVIGYSIPLGSQGTRFYDLVTNTWQPILAWVSLFAAVAGFYLPGIKIGDSIEP